MFPKVAAAQAVVAKHPELVEAMNETGAGNDARFVKFFAQLAEEMGIVEGDDDGTMSPDDAKAAIARIGKAKNYVNGDKATVARMTKLYTRAFPEEATPRLDVARLPRVSSAPASRAAASRRGGNRAEPFRARRRCLGSTTRCGAARRREASREVQRAARP